MTRFFSRYLRPRRPGEYFFFLTWLFVLTIGYPVNRLFGLTIQALVICSVFSFSTGRLSDAGLSRFWALVMLPTLAAPWLCPQLIPGVRPSSVLAQLLDGLFYKRNWRQVALALALLAVPLVIGLAPTRTAKPENESAR